jgi:Subtilase family
VRHPLHAGISAVGHRRLLPGILALALGASIAALVPTAASGTPVRLASSHAVGASHGPVRLLVKYRPEVTAATASGIERSDHAALVRTINPLGVRALDVRAGQVKATLAALRKNPDVSFVEANARVAPAQTVPNDPYYKTGSGALSGGQWEPAKIQAPAAWDLTTGASSAVIAIVDSGVALHPDLVGRLMTGYNVLDGSTNTNDTYGHGTEVAGVAAADTNNGQGLAGTCWNCRLLPVKVYAGSAGALTSDLATGITWAADHGAQVINVSLATTTASATLDAAVSYATSRGALVVAASGNGGCDCVTYPAASPGALAVAASDQTDALYTYSDYGSWVGIDAPSGEVTTSLTDPNTGAQWGYTQVGGTSLAAPVVAGVAGLVLSAAPGMSPAALSALLMQTADPVTGAHAVASGRVNAYRALLAVGGTSPPPSPSSSPSPSPSPSSSPSPSPSPSSSVVAAPATTTFSGSFTTKATTNAFALTMGAGAAKGVLTFTKCTSMALSLTSAGTKLGSASGASAVTLSVTVSAGSYAWTVSGSSRCAYTLTVTYRS